MKHKAWESIRCLLTAIARASPSLETGRTHQIRVHMAHIGHPVEGDPLYNKKNATSLYDKGQLLVAYKLHLTHPITKKEMDFEIPLPDYFTNIINQLD